jgi:hypothetical protein
MQRGILPKDAQLPGLDNNVVFDEEKIKIQAKIKMDNKQQSFTNPLEKKEVKKY